jgi:hypothetical protein
MTTTVIFRRSQVSGLIARVLGDERYYGDSAPAWDDAPRAQDAREARKKAAKRLRRFAGDCPNADQLADIIDQCRPGHRCMSGACPTCGRALQRWFVAQLQRLAGPEVSNIWAVSIAFADHRVPLDRLHTLHTASMVKALRYVLNKAPAISWVAGGIDLSLNDETQKGLDVGWQPQFYGFVSTTNITPLADLLRKRFPKTNKAPRPVHIKLFNGKVEAFSYAFKSVFTKRIGYVDEKNRSNTRKVYLTPKQHVQAMLWMHKIGFSSRLLFSKVRMTRVGHHVELLKIKQLK